jgi:hypothetical protein
LKEEESEPLATNSRRHREKKMSNRTTSIDIDGEIGNNPSPLARWLR